MADNRFDLELGLDFSKVTEALQQIKSQFTGTDAAFQKIANSFKNSFNTMTNAIKLYGTESSQAKTATKAMEKAMVELTKNGVDPASLGFQQLNSQIGPLATKMKGAGDSVKKSNMQWTNLALVIQDLPFGFRGIQNNLPALIGSFAGATGAIYLAGSAIIALFSAMDLGIIKFGNSVKLTTDLAKEAGTAYANETVQLESLYRVATDSNKSMTDRLDAARELKNQYPGLLGVYSEEEIALGKAKTAYTELTTTIWQYALAQAATKALEEIAAKKLPLMIEKTKLLAEERRLAAIEDAKGVQKGIGVYSQYNSQLANVRQRIKENTEEQKGLAKAAADYTPVIDSNINALEKLDRFKRKPGTVKDSKDTYLLDKLKAQQQAYKDDIYAFRNYGILIINEEERLAVSRAMVDGSYEKNKKDIRERYQADRISNDKLFEEKLNAILDENAKKRTKIEERELEIQAQNRLNISHAILAINKQFAEEEKKANDDVLKSSKQNYNQQIKDVNEFYQNKLNLATGNLKEQLNILKEEQLAWDLAYGFRLVGEYDYAKKSGEITKAKVQTEKAIIKESFDSLMQLGNGIMSALGPSLDMLLSKSANIGEVLKSAFNDLLKQLIKVTIAAAIAVALIAILFPKKLETSGGAGKLFGGLFGQGMGLGKDLFAADASTVVPKKAANGGIFGGPAYRMIGEYPGARSNPEVVAPLDKLKDMISGNGGGTLEARVSGNDLLILMNKAQRNNNLSF